MNDTITPPIEITDDNPTDEQLSLAFKRACHEFGDCVADYESDEFTSEFADQLNRLLTEETVRGLIDKGLMTSVVREDGEIGYVLTELGTQVAALAEDSEE